jgi:hypothetical protein
MPSTRLTFVLADRIADFDATCAAAGFDGDAARGVGALYAGLSRSERRVAGAVATRLWLPVSLEPMLTGSRFGFDDEAVEPGLLRAAGRFAAGEAALELALRHRESHVAIVMKSEFVERVVADLHALLPEQIAGETACDRGVQRLALALRGEAALPVSALPPFWTAAGMDAIHGFLRERGADRIAHPAGTLLEHLQRTADVLASFRARPALVAAGLCHAVYGTAGLAPALLSTGERLVLAKLIGLEAEAIVYSYAACDREAGPPSLSRPAMRDRFSGGTVALGEATVRDLAELSCANELDMLRHGTGLDTAARAGIARLLAELRPMLGHRANIAVAEALAAEQR